MKKKAILLTWIILLLQLPVVSQNIGAHDIDQNAIALWVEKENSKYEGVYHFGEGDGSNMVLIVDQGRLTAQIRNTLYWTEGGYAVESGIADISELEMKWEWKNLTNISIVNGQFHSDQYHGEFVHYTDETNDYKGLKIINPWNKWIGKDRYEIGLKLETSLTSWYRGKYPKASYRMIHESELNQMNADTLRIVKNEILARYGYQFIEGGTMNRYFKNQDWYIPRYKNVMPFVTAIELKNIESINKRTTKIIFSVEEARTYIETTFIKKEELLLVSDQLNDALGLNMAMIVDVLLEKGYYPDGFEQKLGYRIYKYIKQ